MRQMQTLSRSCNPARWFIGGMFVLISLGDCGFTQDKDKAQKADKVQASEKPERIALWDGETENKKEVACLDIYHPAKTAGIRSFGARG